MSAANLAMRTSWVALGNQALAGVTSRAHQTILVSPTKLTRTRPAGNEVVGTEEVARLCHRLTSLVRA